MIIYNSYTKSWQDWSEFGSETISELPTKINEHCILLIHGYANGHDDVRSAYTEIYSHIKHIENIDVLGYRWKSRGKAFRYFTDLRTAKDSQKELLGLLYNLKNRGYKKISIMAHSMGAFLVIKAIQNTIPSGLIYRVALMAGDCLRLRFKENNSFGECSNKIDKLTSYYSPYDFVLRFPAIIARPGARIGAHKMPKKCPENYQSFDANLYSIVNIKHNSYKKSPALLVDAIEFLKGNDL